MNAQFSNRLQRATIIPVVALLGASALVFAAQSTQPASPQTNPAPGSTPQTAPPANTPAPTTGARTVQGASPSYPQATPSTRPAPSPSQQPVNNGGDPRNTDRSIPNSQAQLDQNGMGNTWSTPGTALPNQNAVPQGVGFNQPGGMVNSDALQSTAINQVHYHYHYDGAGGFSGNIQPGYSQEQYVNPDYMNQPVNPMNVRVNGGAGGGGMYTNTGNARVGNNGGAGVPVTWNPYLNGGSGMLTYGGGAVEGFND